MRVLKSKPMILLLLSFVALAMVGCGKSKGPGTTAGQPGYYPQQPGMPGMPGYPGTGQIPAGGCAPIQPGMPIPIALNGAMFDSANLIAGPGQALIGGGGGAVGNYILAGQSPDAQMQIGLQLQNLLAAGPMPVMGQGVIMITPTRFQVMLQRFGMGGGMYPGYPTYPGYPQPGYPQMPTQQLCASGIAINIGHYNTRLYGGRVTLVMNGGQFVEELYF
jgi:hypothetical protein